ITLENNLATIDPAKCQGCGKCAEKCPRKVIA
ncbi:MAG: 4Fe-4S binding protein, partial [Eubacterium sp.]|nr:4Fe-4S binding protein [Eubacterium sp.]